MGRCNERRHDRKLFNLIAFIDVTLLPVPPSVLLLCPLHPVPTLRQRVPNKLCAGVLLVMPSIAKCDAIAEYARAIQ
jgi:hypothetical protein